MTSASRRFTTRHTRCGEAGAVGNCGLDGGSPASCTRRALANDNAKITGYDVTGVQAMTSHRQALLYSLLSLAIIVVLLIVLLSCQMPLRT